MREIGVLTTSRADFGIYEPILARMKRSTRLRLRLIVSGSHLDSRFGRTVEEIRRAGFPVFRSFPCLRGGMAESMARMMDGMAKVLGSWKPSLLLVLGDRFEMLAGALAALTFHVPLAHVHGGEHTAGALDDSFRHALSKVSHLHFAATSEAARRLSHMGEDPWRITVSGAPALDRIRQFVPENLDLPDRFLLVTFHPVTLEPGQEGYHARELGASLYRIGLPCVITAPNADPGTEVLSDHLKRLCRRLPRSKYVQSAGSRGYFTLMSRAAAMVGNSSSGILEGPSFRLPVVNIGTRQDGRLRARNVIDCGADAREIERAIRRALSPTFRARLRGLKNPYGDGHAADRIVSRLESVPLDDRLLRKAFYEQ